MHAASGAASRTIFATDLLVQVNGGALLLSVQPRALHSRAVLHKARVGRQAGADFLTMMHPTGLSGNTDSDCRERTQRAAAAIC